MDTRSRSDREIGNELPRGGETRGRAGRENRRGLGWRRALFGAVAAAGIFGSALAARADTVTITTDSSNYTMGTSSSGHSGGGEWGVTNITGLTPPAMGGGGAYSGNVFQSFCLERNESLSPGTYTYTLSNAAHQGGVGGATNGADPISSATVWLFKTWYSGNLTNVNGFSYNYTYGSGRVASAGELQDAFWLLENELTTSQINTSSAGYAWYQAALTHGTMNDATTSELDNVRVMTLTDSNGTNHQDILVLVPLPSAALLGLGLMSAVGAVGLVRRRRNRTVLA